MAKIETVQLVLQIFEGNNFQPLFKDSIINFQATLGQNVIVSDPVSHSNLANPTVDIGQELMWKMTKATFQRYRTTKAVKLECISTTPNGIQNIVGYITIPLKGVSQSCKSSKGWRKLLGTKFNGKNCPQLLLSIWTKVTNTPLNPVLQDEEDSKNLIPDISVKTDCTLVGLERFCNKKFQIICTIDKANNLDVLIPEGSANKQFYLGIKLLGQEYSTSLFHNPGACIELNNTFVLNIMSSKDMLMQFLKNKASVELELIENTSKRVISSFNHFLDQLEFGPLLHLICCMTNSIYKNLHNIPLPTIELKLKLEVANMNKQLNNKTDTEQISKPTAGIENKTKPSPKAKLEDKGIVPELRNHQFTNKTNSHSASSDDESYEEIIERQEDLEKYDSILEETFDLQSSSGSSFSSDTSEDSESEKEELHNELLPENILQEVENPISKQPLEKQQQMECMKLDLQNLNQSSEQVTEQISSSISDVYKSEKLVLLVAELEQWKIHERNRFEKEMKKRKEELFKQWRKEFDEKNTNNETDINSKLASARNLIKKLQLEIRKLEQERSELHSERKNFEEMTKKVMEDSKQMKETYIKKCKDLREKKDILVNQNKKLIREFEMLSHENMRLSRKAQNTESAQLNALKQKIKELEKNVKQVQQEKEKYVKQWIMSQKEAQIKPQYNVQELEKRLETILGNIQLQMKDDDLKIREFQKELDSAYIGKTSLPNSQQMPSNQRNNKQTIDSCLQRLISEREDLLKSGAYGDDNYIIQALTNAIEINQQSTN